MTSSIVSIELGDAGTVQVWKSREDGTLGAPLTLNSNNLRALCARKSRFLNANPVQELERLTGRLVKLGIMIYHPSYFWRELRYGNNNLTELLRCGQITQLFNEALADCRQAVAGQRPDCKITQSSDDEDLHSHVATAILEPLALRLKSPELQNKVCQQLEASALYGGDDSCLSKEIAATTANMAYSRIHEQFVFLLENVSNRGPKPLGIVDRAATILCDDVYLDELLIEEFSVLMYVLKCIHRTSHLQTQFLKGPQICMAVLQTVLGESSSGTKIDGVSELGRALELFSLIWATMHEIAFRFRRHQTADWSSSEKSYAASAYNTFFSQPVNIEEMAADMHDWAKDYYSADKEWLAGDAVACIRDFKVLAQTVDRLDELLDPGLVFALEARKRDIEQPATMAIFEDMVAGLKELQLAFAE